MRVDKAQGKMLLAAGALLALFVVAVLMPLRYQRAGYQVEIDKSRKTLGINLAETQGLVELNESVIQLREVINGAQQYVPQSDELADIIRGLSNALSAYGISDREVETQSTQHYAAYSIIPIELEFESSFPAAFGVLKRIESMRRLIRIEDLKIERDRMESDGPLKVSLSLSTFIARIVVEDEE